MRLPDVIQCRKFHLGDDVEAIEDVQRLHPHRFGRITSR